MPKRADLIRQIKKHAAAAGLNADFTEGAKHTKVTVGDKTTVIPRHREIGEMLARVILKQLNLPH